MIKFDKTEQCIHDAFSQLDVDTEGFRNRLNFSTAKTKKPIKLPTVAAAIFIFVILSVTAYAAVGGFGFIRSILDSPFIDYAVEQLEPVYAEDQGIRIEILAAEQIDDIILIYMTLQDVSGESFAPYNWNPAIHDAMMTMSDEVEMDDGTTRSWGVAYRNPENYAERFRFIGGHAWPDWEIYIDGVRTLAPGAGMGQVIHYDEETRTFYLEQIFSAFSGLDIPNTDTLTLASDRIHISYSYELIENIDPNSYGAIVFYNETVKGDWVFQVNVSDTDHPVLTWEDVTLSLERGDYHFDYIRLSPFGIRGTSTRSLSALFQNWFSIEIEIAGGENIIAGPGGGGNSFHWHASLLLVEDRLIDVLIDVDAVTAIIIDGYRLEIPE